MSILSNNKDLDNIFNEGYNHKISLWLQSPDLEKKLEPLAKLVAQLFETEHALISLFDSTHQHIVASTGLPFKKELKENTLCGFTVKKGGLLKTSDALAHPELSKSPFVSGPPFVKTYVGMPLRTKAGMAFGTICAFDSLSRPINEFKIKILEGLAEQVLTTLRSEQSIIKLSEKSLENKLLEKVLNESSLITKSDFSGVITEVNDLFCKASGYERHEILGKTHNILNSHTHSDEFFQNLWSTIKSGYTWRGQIRNLKKNGDIFWVDTVIVPATNSLGHVTGFVSVQNDITNEKEQEFLTRKIEEYNKSGSWKLNIKTYQPLWSKGTYDIHEVPQGENINILEAINFYPDEEKARITQFVEDCTTNGRAYSENLRFITAKGNKRWVNAQGFPEYNKHGELIAVYGTFQDITESIEKEKKLKEQEAIALHKSKLASVGELAAGVGHEINNPLSVILGFSDEALNLLPQVHDLALRERFSFYLDKINYSSKYISNIVASLRTFSKTTEKDIAPFNATKAIREAIQLVETIYEKRRIKINFSKCQDLYVLGKKGKFQQAIMNILSNAKDALEGVENPLINISLSTDSKIISLEIKDNGHGMLPETLKKVFKPFYTTKSGQNGTGIGMALTHQFIDEMGGTIEVSSEYDKGTSFKISLPKSDMNLMESRKEASNHLDEAKVVINKKKILVVDDDEDIHLIIKHFLRETEHEITSETSALKAIDRLKDSQQHFDIIITDMKMPEMDGGTLIKNIQEIFEHSPETRPKVVCFTGGVNHDFEEQGDVNDLIDGHFYKPFHASDLINVISQVSEIKED